jgi:hypothetical protein
MVISLSAKGLTHGEITAHLAEIYGAEVSRQTITAITGRVMEGLARSAEGTDAAAAAPCAQRHDRQGAAAYPAACRHATAITTVFRQ